MVVVVVVRRRCRLGSAIVFIDHAITQGEAALQDGGACLREGEPRLEVANAALLARSECLLMRHPLIAVGDGRPKHREVGMPPGRHRSDGW